MTDVFAGFRPPCWCPSRWAPTWRLHTHFYKFLRISPTRKIAVTWILARVFAYLPSFYFQILDLIYWTVSIFILIYFEWRDTENQHYYLVTFVESQWFTQICLIFHNIFFNHHVHHSSKLTELKSTFCYLKRNLFKATVYLTAFRSRVSVSWPRQYTN